MSNYKRRITGVLCSVSEVEKKQMRDLKREGLPYSTISKIVGFSDKTVAYHIVSGAKARKRKITKKWEKKPSTGGRLRKKLSDFNRAFSVAVKKTVSERTQLHYDSKPNMRIYKKLYGFLNKKGGIMAEYREVLEKLWPDEDNENRTEFWTKCVLSGRDINLNVKEKEANCGAFDHQLPRGRGGSNNIDNCQPLDALINYMKHDRTNEEFIEICKEVLTYQGYTVNEIED